MQPTSKNKESGAALLLFLLVVIVAFTTILVTALSRDALAAQQQLTTRAALEQARQALLDYAVLRGDRGDGLSLALPCPDIDESGGFADGVAHDTACGAADTTVAGRLPWKTLGLPSLRDSSGACLWYVVSGNYKDAATETAEMINPDNAGQIQLYDVETGNLVSGLLPEERPAALVIAAMPTVAGQARASAATGRQCAPGASIDDYLDLDTGSGISNALLTGTPDSIDLFARSTGFSAVHNDRVAVVSRTDIAAGLFARSDFDAVIRDLGLAVAGCVANYAANNPGGVTDRRLPWPSQVSLSDYRRSANYDDANTGDLSGRLADVVNDSSALTGNAVTRVFTDCDAAAVPTWTPAMAARWEHWKDHFFYAVAPAFAPGATLPTNCGSCLSVNGAGQYVAVVLFAGPTLGGQVRRAPPLDIDSKLQPANYLEGDNAAAIPGIATNYVSASASPVFNDRVFCVDASLAVSEC